MRFKPALAALLALCSALLVLSRSPTAHAQSQSVATAAAVSAPPTPAPTSLWRGDWPEFRTSEGVLTLLAGATTAVIVVIGPATNPRWEGGILFDNAVRNAIRAKDPHTRQTYRTIGNWTYHLSPVLPLADALLVSTIAHSDSKLALNLTLMAFEAYSYTGVSAFTATEISARSRPDHGDTQTFFSGHAAISATGAGLMCANHTRLPLWGNPVADAAACVLASTNALVTATTRVVADRHYASDVILGLGVGFGFGYAVPVLLHYSYGNGGDRISLGPDPSCGGNCVAVSGTF